MNQTAFEECMIAGDESYSDEKKLVSRVYSALVLILILVSLTLWFRLANDSNPLLKQRDKFQILHLATIWVLSIITSPLSKAYGEINESLGCSVFTALIICESSMLAFVVVFRLWWWITRVGVNKKISEYYDEHSRLFYAETTGKESTYSAKESSLKDDVDQFNNEINRIRQPIRTKRLQFFYITGTVAQMLLNFILSTWGCYLDSCVFGAETSSHADDVIRGILFVGIIIFAAYTYHATRGFPDSYSFFAEIKIVVGIGVAFNLLEVVFVRCNVLNSEYSGTKILDLLVIQDASHFSVFSIMLLWPLLLNHYQKTNKLDLRNHFLSVLDSTHQKKLFRSYLIYGHSIESLTFYDAVVSWKKNFTKNSMTLNVQTARNIHARWILQRRGDESKPIVNLPFNIVEKLNNKLNERNTWLENELFDDAASEIFNLMLLDAFPRYLGSNIYKQHVEEENEGTEHEL